MHLSEAEALAALDALRERHLVVEVSGQRAMRWEHNFERVLAVPSQAAALLGLLILRGPQNRRRAAHQCRALAPLCRHLLGRSVFGRTARAQRRQRRPAGAPAAQSPRRARGHVGRNCCAGNRWCRQRLRPTTAQQRPDGRT